MEQVNLPGANITSDARVDNADLSLVLGGPLYQLYLHTRLVKPSLGLVRRRIVCMSLICWGPPLLLALFAGRAWGGVSVPFLFDLGVHVRFLLALPLLIVAEVIVHQRIPAIVRQFVERNIIATEDRPRFAEIIASTKRLRNSAVVEVLLLVFAFSLHWLWKEPLMWSVSTWYAVKADDATHLTAAGYWYTLVSLSIFRFIIARWYFRLFVWYRFLWNVRRLPFHLNLFHPDRAGGLGFLAGSTLAFSPVLAAQTILLAGVIADQIRHAGATLTSFKMEIVGMVVFLILLVLTPLSFFMVRLERAGRIAKWEYGVMASRYVDDFHRKWIERDNPGAQPLLGTPDIQSLADLGNGYGVVTGMRILPFGKDTVIRLAIIIVIPLLPLTLTMIPLEQIVDRLIKLLL
jgi:hypothetical protein